VDNKVRLWVRWARAHVAVTVGHPISNWTDEEVLDAFSVIRHPPISFEEWCVRMGFTQEEKPDSLEEINDRGAAILTAFSKRLPWVRVA